MAGFFRGVTQTVTADNAHYVKLTRTSGFARQIPWSGPVDTSERENYFVVIRAWAGEENPDQLKGLQLDHIR